MNNLDLTPSSELMNSSMDKHENLLIESSQKKLSEYLRQIKKEAEKNTESLGLNKRKLEEVMAQNEKLLNILKKSFMYKTYKALNPDLKDLDDKSLLQHYISFGFDEARNCDEKAAKELERTKYNYQHSRIIQELARAYLQEKSPQDLDEQDHASETNNHCRKISKTIGTRISLDENKDFKFALAHTLYEPTSKCLATFIPKNGCTNLRYSFALANNLISGSQDIDWIHTNNQSMNANLENVQNSIYSFVVLRNPYERLASAFWNKFVEVEGDHYKNESSGPIFRDLLNSETEDGQINSFKDFVNVLWKNPLLISKDTHLRHQTDFLLLSNYDEYFSLTQFQSLKSIVQKRSGLVITDTREITRHTTYGYSEKNDKYYGNSKITELSEIKKQKKYIKYSNFYDEEDCYRATLIYLNDIITYIERTDDLKSTQAYLHKGLLYSTNYQI